MQQTNAISAPACAGSEDQDGVVADVIDDEAVTGKIPRALRRRGMVLVVDDSEDAQELFRTSLHAAGYAVIAARNGKEALELLMDHATPLLIVLDLLMPVMDGLEFIDVLRSYSRFAQVPIVIVSASDGRGAVRSPLMRYLAKPVHHSELLRIVEEVVAARPSGGI